MKRISMLGLAGWLAVLPASLRGEAPSAAAPRWPYPIPCRIQDGANPDLFVMTLGAVQTPIADGVFDPVQDSVTLRDGTVRSNYYRDTLGVKFYRPLDKTHFPLPPSGMCTWYYYYTRINETEVRRNAEWMAANLKDYGAQYVQIDDGWQGTGAKGSARNWEAINTNRFPGGMATLARDIKKLGLTPGLWLAPHGQNNDDVVNANPGVFLLKTNGETASDTWEGRFLVDATHTNAVRYLNRLFTKLTDWGYEYFKIDGQPIVVEEYAAKNNYLHQPGGDAAELYRQTLRAIRATIGPDRYLLGCWGLPIEGAGIFDGSRTGGDIVLGWGGFQVALRPTMEFYHLHNIVWYSDPDVMLVRPPLTLDQARVWATLQGLTGQALMSSDRLMDLPEERVELLRRVYPAVDIRPLDLFPSARDKRIWDLKVNHLGRNYDVVGVFNFGESRAEQTLLKWRDLGLPAGRRMHVYDFWNREYLGSWGEGFAVDVAPTSCRVLTLLPDNGRIQLLSTSRHISQGWVDLADLQINRSGNVYRGTSRVVKDDPYQLRFVFPRGTNYMITRAVAKGGGRLPVKVENHQGWATATFTAPATREVSWEIEFGPAEFYHYPTSAPERLAVERAGLDGVNLVWSEQYYLNAGYEVYLDGALQGHTPRAVFPLRGLDAHSNYTAQVRTIWEDGGESPKAGEVKFQLAALLPEKLPLTQLEPTRFKGRWDGFESENQLPGGTVSIGGRRFADALSAFGESEAEFNLKGLYDQFAAVVGVDEKSAPDCAVEFSLVGDGQELWRSGAMSSRSGAQSVNVRVAGVQRLVLRSQRSGAARGRIRVVWAEAVIANRPTPGATSAEK